MSSSRSLIKMWDRTGLRIEELHLQEVQMTHYPLPSELDDSHSFSLNKQSTYLDHSVPTWIQGCCCGETTPKVLLKSKQIISTALCLIHRPSHFITEGDWVGQTWFTFGKPMMAISNKQQHLHMPTADFWVDLVNDFCMDQSEVDQPVVPWVMLLALLEDGWSICHSPVIQKILQSPWPCKDDRAWLF